MCQTLTLEKLYHHIFFTPGQTKANSDQLTHDLVLWLNHHSFEELPDALEYYLAIPNSDLYNLLDRPRHDFLAAQLHLHNSTFPRLYYPDLEAPYPPK